MVYTWALMPLLHKGYLEEQVCIITIMMTIFHYASKDLIVQIGKGALERFSQNVLQGIGAGFSLYGRVGP